jgi:hypothetical protein
MVRCTRITQNQRPPFSTYCIDSDLLRLGAGYIHPIAPDWDANLIIGYQRVGDTISISTPRGTYRLNPDDESDGLFLRGGVRGMITPSIELSGFSA